MSIGGQDLWFLKEWKDAHPEAGPLHVAYFGPYEPWVVYPEFKPPGDGLPRPGWYAVSVNRLYGIMPGAREVAQEYACFRRLRPVSRAGYSIWIYHVSAEEADRLRRAAGMPPLPPR